MAAKKDKMIPSEKERKRALKYATPAGTGHSQENRMQAPPTLGENPEMAHHVSC